MQLRIAQQQLLCNEKDDNIKKVCDDDDHNMKYNTITVLPLKKLNGVIDDLNSQMSNSRQELIQRDTEWQNELEKTEQISKSYLMKLQVYEQERERFSTYKRELDTSKVKITELEDKIKRQEQYLKTRILKDKTNAPRPLEEHNTKDMLKHPPIPPQNLSVGNSMMGPASLPASSSDKLPRRPRHF